ncbi:hypothetical protein [Paraburkholderia sp. BL17N1]|uniref:hypothetical protein n=1 Tax=Paraburkholderia sp. BL17N1 TaxID=1938798 RepID=UPI000F22EAFD|nr:hypothetical protein [Paraburkholderia sp. BL17N1]RKR45940.1 hypothetical protein B0G82_3606 [Paraburkholderia sp. BL17N1]
MKTTAAQLQARFPETYLEDNHDFMRGDGGYAIRCSGHYTLAVLEYRLCRLKEANKFSV